MPAGNENITKITEDAVISQLEGILESGSQKYHVDRFYGTFDPQALYNYMVSKLNTMNGSMYVRATEDDAVAQDTLGLMVNLTVNIEVLVAYPPMQEEQLGNPSRFTDVMSRDLQAELVGHKINFSDQSPRIRYQGKASLFRDDKVDAQLVRFRLQGVVKSFNETI